IKHTTGILHSPTRQAIVERAHGTLKNMLEKQKRGSVGCSPHKRLQKALYVLNFLNRCVNDKSPIKINFAPGSSHIGGKAQVQIRNLETSAWEGP
ncbi:POK19 protein, partial [Anseranas semipalmata]|nr:POK19 protein [Anseranas semipalmata]